MTYETTGTCATHIDFDLQDGKVHNVAFTKGCNGNLKAISMLLEGRPATEIIALFKGNLCKNKGTSCADQLARALEKALDEKTP
jgi:uncharacterized protein (TIGR03905 family)